MTAPAVVSELLQLAWVAPLAVTVVACSYSFGLLGATRAGEHRREGNVGLAGAYLALAIISGAVFVSAVVAGLLVIVLG